MMILLIFLTMGPFGDEVTIYWPQVMVLEILLEITLLVGVL